VTAPQCQEQKMLADGDNTVYAHITALFQSFKHALLHARALTFPVFVILVDNRGGLGQSTMY